MRRQDVAVFLDRDGTINREVHHLNRVEDFELLDGAAQAIRLLNEAGVRVVVVTNQAAVGRGLLSERGLNDIHASMEQQLHEHGAHVDSIYSCPHHPTAGIGVYGVECTCRKPRPGSLERAARELGLDLERSFIVGDKQSDLDAGASVGCKTVLVRTGYGREVEEQFEHSTTTESHDAVSASSNKTAVKPARNDGRLADHIANNLLEAAQWILAEIT